MTLDEFISVKKDLLDDFVAEYMRRRKKKPMTMIRNPVEWQGLLNEFLEVHDGNEQAEETQDDNSTRQRAA